MRGLELSTPLPASAEAAWQALVRLDGWPAWGRLVVSAEGVFEPGSRWTMQLHAGGSRRTMRPYFVAMTEGERLLFETRLPGVTMQHAFEVAPEGAERSVLHQRFEARGPLMPLLWRWLQPGMLQFDQLGEDLARHLGAT